MKILNMIVDTFVAIMMVSSAFVLFTLTFLQVVSRYVFQIPIPWSTDIIRLSFAYSIFFGAAWAAKKNNHLNLDFVLSLLNPKPRLALEFVIFSILTVFCGFIAFFGWRFTAFFGMIQSLPYLGIPMAIVYISIPIGGFIMAFYYLQHAINTILQLMPKNAES